LKAAIIGATGLVGQKLLEQLLKSDRYTEVHAIGRRAIEREHPKLVQHVTDLDALDALQLNTVIDHGYCVLGTTIRQAGTADAFQQVDRDFVCKFGRLMKQASATGLAVNSSLGANARSGNLYLRTKGEMEQCLREREFDCLAIVRPSLLVPTERKEFRLGELVGFRLFQLLGWLLVGPLRRYRPVEPAAVASALIHSLLQEHVGVVIIESESIPAAGQEP
jgi:uncharacterized protein YbjT (DUF2867 family)